MKIYLQKIFKNPIGDVIVTNANDSGTGSLRWAVDTVPANGTIGFSNDILSKTIDIRSPININNNCTILKNPNGLIKINADNTRIFNINAEVEISGIHFTGNSNEYLINYSSAGFINNCLFNNIIANVAILYLNNYVTVSNCMFKNCTVNTSGYSGVIVAASEPDVSEIFNCSFINNTITAESTHSGICVNIYESEVYMWNSLFAYNNTPFYLIYNDPWTIIYLYHNTFVNNIISGYLFSHGIYDIRNTIIRNNIGGINFHPNATINTTTNVVDNYNNGTVVNSNNDIFADPELYKLNIDNNLLGYYSLNPNSPCINNGTWIPGILEYDIRGTRRVVSDVGNYESFY